MKILKSIGAVLAGLVFIIFTHTLTDLILESAGVFPPPDQGLHVTWMLVFALVYRIILSIIGCFITAKLAPTNPIRHALILGLIGVFASTAGAIFAIRMDLADAWYPIALVLVSLPCAWIGGRLAERNAKIT
jgi:uncharacterized membrane protein